MDTNLKEKSELYNVKSMESSFRKNNRNKSHFIHFEENSKNYQRPKSVYMKGSKFPSSTKNSDKSNSIFKEKKSFSYKNRNNNEKSKNDYIESLKNISELNSLENSVLLSKNELKSKILDNFQNEEIKKTDKEIFLGNNLNEHKNRIEGILKSPKEINNKKNLFNCQECCEYKREIKILKNYIEDLEEKIKNYKESNIDLTNLIEKKNEEICLWLFKKNIIKKKNYNFNNKKFI